MFADGLAVDGLRSLLDFDQAEDQIHRGVLPLPVVPTNPTVLLAGLVTLKFFSAGCGALEYRY